MGMIVGITGAIGSGKTTLASMLTELEPSHAVYETSQLIAEVAEDFNRALSGELAFETANDDVELANQALIWFVEAINEQLHQDVTWNQLAITKHQLAANPALFEKLFTYIDQVKKQPPLLEARITTENKGTYRPLLQWLGNYLIAKVSKTIWYDEIFRRIALHDDDKNLIVIGGVRYPSDAMVVHEHDGLLVEVSRVGDQTDTTNLTDPTEASRSEIKADVHILNNGSLEQLQAVVNKLWLDLSVSKHVAHYSAATT